MIAPVPPVPGTPERPLLCPSCGRVLEAVMVNPAGELLGCETCADGMDVASEPMTLEEWNSDGLVREVLAQYPLDAPTFGKPDVTPTLRPRAHYWEVQAGGRHYFLKRFHDWYPAASIRHMHSILECVRDAGLPVARAVADRTGHDFVQADGSHWALYTALEGRVADEREWMWGRPKAAELLGTLHATLAGFRPEGEAFAPWTAWTIETVDRVLEGWPDHPDLPVDLLEFVRDRLATRYFAELYPELPKLIVHGDFVAANLLWRGDAVSASIAGILDFERAHPDTALFDFAWGLGDRRPPLLRATVATYTRARPLAPVEREALPEAMLLGTVMDIDMQMTYFGNMRQVTRLARELGLLARDLEALRKAVAIKGPVSAF